MFKKCIALFLVACISIAVCGCGAENKTDSSSALSAEDIYTDISVEDVVYEDTSADNMDSSSLKERSSSKNPDNSSVISGQNRPGSSSSRPSGGAITTSGSTKFPSKPKRILVRKATHKYFKMVGRCDIGTTTGVYLALGCASIEFNLLCKDTISLDFSMSGSNPAYLKIYVDGKLIEERTKISVAGELEIASGLAEGVHNVKIVRSTDAEKGAHLTLNAIITCGSLVETAPANKKLYIEAIGDSNIIGLGVRLEDSFFKNYNPKEEVNGKTKESITHNAEYMDGTLAYPYVAAQKLDADCYVYARQGAGIAATYHKTGANVNGTNMQICNNTQSGGLLPVLYDYVSINNSRRYTPTRTPNIIVLDAGAADVNASLLSSVLYGDKVGINQETAKEIAKEFLLKLKKQNPGVKVIWCYGLGTNSEALKNYVLDTINKAGGEAAGFYSLQLKTSTRSCYPSKKEYEESANLLVNKIKEITKQ